MTRVVVSQPMFFPWVGMFEQIRLADIYVNYSDVQFSKGSFTNRVQIKTSAGRKWLTLPLADLHLGQCIDEVRINNLKDWRKSHRDLLRQSYRAAPFCSDMLALVDDVYGLPSSSLAEIAEASLMASCRYFGLDAGKRFLDVRDMGIGGESSQRVFNIVRTLQGTCYITGHGARNYLDHDLFERAGISVEYMDYRKLAYPQLHGDFTPFVSILDLIANEGRAGIARIASVSVDWKESSK